MVEESGKIENQESETFVFSSKSFLRWSIGFNLMVMVSSSMSIMFVLIALGLNMLIITILFIGVMVGVMYLLSGATTYVLSNKGISQQITPSFHGFKPIQRNFSWLEMEAYERGVDRAKSGNEYNYLYIDVSKPPGKLRLTDDKWDKIAFAAFANAFEAYIGETEKNLLKPDQLIPSVPSDEAKPIVQKPILAAHHIVKKRTFYEKPIAKVITILFVVLCAALFYFNNLHGMSESNFYKLNFVIIPGTAYMVFRVFFKGR